MTGIFAADEYLPSVIDLSKGPWIRIILPASAVPGSSGQIEWIETASGAMVADLYSSELLDGSGNVIQQKVQLTGTYPLGTAGTRPASTEQSIWLLSQLTGNDNASTSLALNTVEGTNPGAVSTHEARVDLQPGLRGAAAFARTIIDALGQSSFLQWRGNTKSNLCVQIGTIASLPIVSGVHQVSIPLARAWTTTHSMFIAFVTAASTDVTNVPAVGVQDTSNGFMKINSSVSQNISVAYLSLGI